MDFLRPPFDWKYAVSYTNSRDGNARMFVMNEQWSLYWVSLDRCRVWAVWDRCWHYVRLLFEVWLWLLSDAHLSWVSNIVQQTCRWGNFKGVADPKMIYSPLCRSKSMSYYFPGNTHGEFGENLYSLWTFNRYKLTTAVKLQKCQNNHEPRMKSIQLMLYIRYTKFGMLWHLIYPAISCHKRREK